MDNEISKPSRRSAKVLKLSEKELEILKDSVISALVLRNDTKSISEALRKSIQLNKAMGGDKSIFTKYRFIDLRRTFFYNFENEIDNLIRNVKEDTVKMYHAYKKMDKIEEKKNLFNTVVGFFKNIFK